MRTDVAVSSAGLAVGLAVAALGAGVGLSEAPFLIEVLRTVTDRPCAEQADEKDEGVTAAVMAVRPPLGAALLGTDTTTRTATPLAARSRLLVLVAAAAAAPSAETETEM